MPEKQKLAILIEISREIAAGLITSQKNTKTLLRRTMPGTRPKTRGYQRGAIKKVTDNKLPWGNGGFSCCNS